VCGLLVDESALHVINCLIKSSI